jgi:hypothetical protein
LQQVEIMPAQIHGSDFEAPGEKGLVEGVFKSFHSFGLADADDFHKLKQLSLQTLSRGWGGPNWHVFSMGRYHPLGELGVTLGECEKRFSRSRGSVQDSTMPCFIA